MIKLIECPRDAMQGIHQFIPTDIKIKYINSLLNVGFDTLDFGSFVSPKAIPQLSDTAEVLAGLNLTNTRSKLLAIIANTRGAETAASFEQIAYLGYPFSISETFQRRNTNRGILEAFEDVKIIQEICLKSNKNLVIYISMGFGNPYSDPWNADFVTEWVSKLSKLGIKIFSLSDTVGSAHIDDISYIFKNIIPAFPSLEFGAHFHSRVEIQNEKIYAAYAAGCQRFDAALLGFGGCPMAEDDLVGNTATEIMLPFLEQQGENLNLNQEALAESMNIANEIFSAYF